MHTSRVVGEESSLFTMAGLILEAAMDLDAVDVGRFEVGHFGDFRLQKRGPGVIRHWWLRRGLAYWLWRMADGRVRSVSGDFCAILR